MCLGQGRADKCMVTPHGRPGTAASRCLGKHAMLPYHISIGRLSRLQLHESVVRQESRDRFILGATAASVGAAPSVVAD